MAFSVCLTEAACRDLEDLYDFIARYDAPAKADRVLDQLEAAMARLANTPERGVYPKELLALGIREYRELHVKPYRLLYQVRDKTVFVMLITDGRRDMQALLQRRLLG